MKKNKLTRVQRLYIYTEMLAWIKSVPDATEEMYTGAVIDNLEDAYIASFCSAIHEINMKFRAAEIGSDCNHRLIFIEDLNELYKPASGWQHNRSFWFHPYDKNTRITVLNDIITRMIKNDKNSIVRKIWKKLF